MKKMNPCSFFGHYMISLCHEKAIPVMVLLKIDRFRALGCFLCIYTASTCTGFFVQLSGVSLSVRTSVCMQSCSLLGNTWERPCKEEISLIGRNIFRIISFEQCSPQTTSLERRCRIFLNKLYFLDLKKKNQS